MAKQKKQSLLNGALILSLAIVGVKLVGLFFKLYITLKIGYDGKGYYATAYNIYTPVYSIALAGLPTAVARIVAEKAAQGRYKDIRNLFDISRMLFTLLGFLGTVVILIIAYPFAESTNSINAIPSILCIAPSLFFCCIMAGYRGYYQGLQNMTPSAVSQTFEALGKLIFGWVLINAVLGAGVNFADNIPFLNSFITDKVQAYSSAAAIAGITLGSLAGLIYLMIRHTAKSDGITPEELLSSPDPEKSSKLTKELIKLAIPMALSSLVFNVTTLIDNWTIQNRLMYVLNNNYDTVAAMYPGIVSARGYGVFTQENATLFKNYLYGAYDTVLEIKNIVPTFTVTLGLSALPVLSSSWIKKDMLTVQKSVQTVFRMTMLLAAPAGCGMMVLAEEILTILYGSSAVNAPAIPYIAPILVMYGFSVFLLALTQPITSMLQAVGKEDVPIKAMAIGAIVKLIANFVLVSIPSFNIQGAVFGSILCNVVICVYGMVVLAKTANIRYDWNSSFIKPMFCGVLSAIAAWAVNGICEKKLPEAGFTAVLGLLTRENTAAILGIIAAVIVYILAVFATRTLLEEDLETLPMGRKLVKVLTKLKMVG